MIASIILSVFMVLSVSADRVVFDDDTTITRSADDGVVVEAVGTPAASGDEVNTRIFGGLLGGLFGGGIGGSICFNPALVVILLPYSC